MEEVVTDSINEDLDEIATEMKSAAAPLEQAEASNPIEGNGNGDAAPTETAEPCEAMEEDVNMDGDELKEQARGSGFRGRGWFPPGASPRFRGRGGFGGGPPGMSPGRGGRGGGGLMHPPPFMRGRGGPHGGPRFPHGNYDPNNWGGQQMDNPNSQPPALELWVETKTEEGKSYFYHAITREATWTKPDGPNVKVMTQAEVEAMNAKNNQQANAETNGAQNAINNMGKEGLNIDGTPISSNQTPNSMESQAKIEEQHPNIAQPPPLGMAPVQHQQHMPNMFPGGGPPQFQGPPPGFGMPPPGYGAYQPAPWNVPWSQQNVFNQEPPAKNLIAKAGIIEPMVIARAAEWSEHRAPDGRPYYYHAGRNESVWEKPQAIRDLEAARMAAHSGVTPQALAQNSNMLQQPPMGQPPMFSLPAPGMAPPGFDPSAMFAAAAASAKPTEEVPGKVEKEDSSERKRKADEEKKKKEEEEKVKAQAKPVDKSRPISSTPIAGTPWCVVWTGDGRVFFYNPSTRTSVWERPDELLKRPDVDKAISNAPDELETTVKEVREVVKKDVKPQVEINIIKSDSDCTIVDEVPAKKMKVERIEIIETKKGDVTSEAAMEAEVRAAKERALLPLDVRVKSFKEMLREKDVSAFSTWEKELHKIVFDQRYLLLTSRERKQVFEKYVKERAEEERKEKRNKVRMKREEFRALMETANLHGKSSFSDFSQRYGKDDRYKGIEKVRERESLFNEFIVELRRREKEQRLQKKEEVRKKFIEMLRERSDIDRHCRWTDIRKKFESDSRYRAVENSILREDYFLDYCKIMKEEKRKQKEKDREREKEKEREKKDKKSSKDEKKSKDKNRDKSKEKETAKATESKSDDADISTKKNDEEDGEHPQTSDDEADRQQKEREKRIREELSLKEREKEVQRTLANHMRDRDKERQHHKRDEAVRHFNALLADLVRNNDLSWKEAKKQLRKDHRWELVDDLDRESKERIFNEHIDNLTKKKRGKFREMLDEISSLDLTSSWKDIKKQIRDDPRYLKYSNSEKCEREFREYMKDKSIEAKTSLRELLQECKLITHKSFETFKENPNHLKDINDILKNDKRFLVLEHVGTERSQIIMSYLEDLHNRGPPPPPTASDSVRRK